MHASDGYTIKNYGEMINDRARTDPYVKALRSSIEPGSVVLDIGAGTGIFAFLACQFGAARVYAVEPNGAINVAKQCAANIPDSDRIVWLQGLSTEVDLPEQVDIVIADLRGILPFHNFSIDSLSDARRRHLKPGGRMIPERDLLRAVPAQAAMEYEKVVVPWQRNDFGIDLNAGWPFVCNDWWRARSDPASPEDLLASPGTWAEIDYLRTESPNLDGHIEWRIDRPGTLHGLYVWFDCEMADGLGFSNAPDLPALVYGRGFFPMAQAIEVVRGDQVGARITATRVAGKYVYRWNTRIMDSAGNLKGDFKQSTFNSRPIDPQELRRVAADFVPTLNLDGQIDRAIIQAMADARSLGQIAASIAMQYPQRFTNFTAALNHVAKVSVRYSV